MFEVRSLQDLARISIRQILKKSGSGSMPLSRRTGSKRRNNLRHKREPRDTALLTNSYLFMSRLIPGPMDNNNNQSASDNEDDDEDCRRVCEQEEKEENGRRKEGSVLVSEIPLNILRERILSLPLPEPLKMYLLYYREK